MNIIIMPNIKVRFIGNALEERWECLIFISSLGGSREMQPMAPVRD